LFNSVNFLTGRSFAQLAEARSLSISNAHGLPGPEELVRIPGSTTSSYRMEEIQRIELEVGLKVGGAGKKDDVQKVRSHFFCVGVAT
jgi:hypothetical protein